MNIQGKTVIFGGSGFIGCSLITHLVARGYENIISIDHKDPLQREDGVEYVTADVRNLDHITVPGKVERIYDLAALCVIPKYEAYEYYDTNVSGAISITAFARRHDVHDIVFVSSMATYGTGERVLSEDAEQIPENAYGWSKLLAERAYLAWCGEETHRKLVICRPAVIFGAGEGANFTRLAKVLKTGFFIFPGRRDTIKACFYVKDLVDTLRVVPEKNEKITIFNACYDHVYTLEGILNSFKAIGFEKIRTATIPLPIIIYATKALTSFSTLGLGLHPDRIRKLANSTNLDPAWLRLNGLAKEDELSNALLDWKDETNGRME